MSVSLACAVVLTLAACGGTSELSRGSIAPAGQDETIAVTDTATDSAPAPTSSPPPVTSTPVDPIGLDLGVPHEELIGVSYQKNDPTAMNDQHAIPQKLGLAPNIVSMGSLPIYGESGAFGAVLVLGDFENPNARVWLFGRMSQPNPDQLVVETTDILDVVLEEGQAFSTDQVGCFGDGYPAESLFAIIPRADDGVTEVEAIRAWFYGEDGLQDVDPASVRCRVFGGEPITTGPVEATVPVDSSATA